MVRLHVPPGWREVDDRPAGVLALLAGPGATAVLTREPAPSADLAAWTRTTRADLARVLPRMHLLDAEPVPTAAGPGFRHLVHHPTPTGARVLEQWLVPADLVLSCSAAAPDYDDALAGTFAAVAASVPPRPTPQEEPT